jgi:antitoxin YefM
VFQHQQGFFYAQNLGFLKVCQVLSADFIQALKKTYRHREIEIIVQEIEDETDYLLSSDNNKKHLLSAIKNVKNLTDMVQVDVDSL